MSQNPKTSSGNSVHFEALFNFARIGILVSDRNGRIEAINPFALREFGYQENELIGERIEVLIPFRFREKHTNYHKEYFEQPGEKMMCQAREQFGLRKDGSEFPVEISLCRYHHNEREFVIAFISDISERKEAAEKYTRLNDRLEATVEQRTKDLRETLGRLEVTNVKLEEALSFQNALLNNAGVIIVSTDPEGVIQSINAEGEKELGYTADEIAGKHTPLIFHDADEIKLLAENLSGALGISFRPGMELFLEKARRGVHDEGELTFIRKDGTSFPGMLNITAMKDDQGKITGFLGVAVNISERKKAEDDLHRALKKEKELNELKSRFVSMASHEFRTPLSTILSSSYLIEKYGAADEQSKREKHLHRIISSVNMLTDLLNDFLNVGKIEEGKIHTRYAEFNVPELIEGLASEMNDNLKNGQVIRYRHSGGSKAYLDMSLMKHIIMNLVSNAGKFSPENSPIEIYTSCTNHSLVLSVKDYGIGISAEDQKHLMERFFRGSNAGTVQGTGLGLHIVSKYAELMNGKLEWTSELGQGSVFKIVFTTKEV